MLRHGAVATLILAVGLGSSARPREDELVVFVHGWKAGGQTVKRLLNATVGPRHIVSAFADDAHLLWPPGSALTQALELPPPPPAEKREEQPRKKRKRAAR